MIREYAPPKHNEKAFDCPTCGVYAQQNWYHGCGVYTGGGGHTAMQFLSVARCSHCGSFNVWVDDHMVSPSSGTAPLPHPKMPAAIRQDFEEARGIANLSPKGAAALLRLAIQRLCIELKTPGKNINDDIGALVKQGLPVGVQQALDVVRVIGNNAVHPGQIDLNDDPNAVVMLFKLVNIIVEKMIGEPEAIRQLFDGLPAGAKAQIAKRDGP